MMWLLMMIVCSGSGERNDLLTRTSVITRAFDSTGGEHWYRIALSSGDIARVSVAQRNLDVVVTTFAPNGRVLDEVDGPTGANGIENVAIEATASGTYRLRIKPFERPENGSYEMRVSFIGANRDPTAARLERTAASMRESAVVMEVRQPSAELWRAVDGFLDDAQVVGVGEATHGSAEFVALRSLITTRAVTKHGYRAIAIECSFTECGIALDEYANGKRRDKPNLSGWILNTAEFWTLVEWVRKHNAGTPQGDRVHFIGVDPQGNALGTRAVAHHLGRMPPILTKIDEGDAASLRFETARFDAEDVAALHELASQVKGARVARFVEIMTQFAVLNAPSVRTETSTRDWFMAENLLAELGSRKAVFFAHNSHVAAARVGSFQPTGFHLRQRLGAKYIALGTSFNRGAFLAQDEPQPAKPIHVRTFSIGAAPDDSLEGVLRRVGGDRLIDMRESGRRWFPTPQRMHWAGGIYSKDWGLSRQMRTFDIAEAFDSIAYFEDLSASQSTIADVGDARADQRAMGGSYVVTITAAHPLVAHVQAELPAGSRALHTAAWGASHMANGWGSFISNLRAGDVALEPGPNATWTAATDGPLRLTYDVDLSFAQREWPSGNEQAGMFEDGALFLVSKALFIVSDVTGERHVTFRVPNEWQIATPWVPLGDRTYNAVNVGDLINNTLVLGKLNPREFSVGDFTVTLALLGNMEQSHALIAETLRKVLHAYGEVFGDVPKGRYLLTLFAAGDTDAEAYASSAAFTERDALTRNNIIGWGNTIAHELFHSWNGIRIAGRDYASSQWLGEGFTEYFANLALIQEGLIPMTVFHSKVEQNLGLYTYFRSSPLFADVSLVDAGKNKGRNRLGVYGGGWTAAFALDMEIRRASEGRRTLRDFMRVMLLRFGAVDSPYTIDDVIAVASEVAAVDMNPFFQRYVIGTEMLPIEESLRRAGFDVYTPFYSGELYIWPTGTDAIWPAWTRQ